MRVIILALHNNEAERICHAANWNLHSVQAPKVFSVKENGYEERLYGLHGGLCLITEGAMRYGISANVVGMLVAHNFTVMVLQEPIQAANHNLTVQMRGVKFR